LADVAAEQIDGPGEFRVNYKKTALLAVTLAALAACSGKDPLTVKSNGDAPPQLDSTQRIKVARKLSEIAGQANGAAPADIDENTRLEGAKAGPGLKLSTTYTLVHADTEGVDSSNFEAKLGPVVKQGSCANPDLRPLIDLGVVVTLEYNGTDGKPIGTINVDRATCRSLKPPAPPPTKEAQ